MRFAGDGVSCSASRSAASPAAPRVLDPSRRCVTSGDPSTRGDLPTGIGEARDVRPGVALEAARPRRCPNGVPCGTKYGSARGGTAAGAVAIGGRARLRLALLGAGAHRGARRARGGHCRGTGGGREWRGAERAAHGVRASRARDGVTERLHVDVTRSLLGVETRGLTTNGINRTDGRCERPGGRGDARGPSGERRGQAGVSQSSVADDTSLASRGGERKRRVPVGSGARPIGASERSDEWIINSPSWNLARDPDRWKGSPRVSSGRARRWAGRNAPVATLRRRVARGRSFWSTGAGRARVLARDNEEGRSQQNFCQKPHPRQSRGCAAVT